MFSTGLNLFLGKTKMKTFFDKKLPLLDKYIKEYFKLEK